jgi:hydrogenase maturation protein HypF
VQSVQHHFAHVTACLAENHLAPPALGVAWDGTGDGQDGTIWGGEFLRANRDASFTRVAALRPFRLPGGEAAVREPRRTALGVLFEIFGPAVADDPHLAGSFERAERRLVMLALGRNINTPVTTSAGRLFDAIAALLGICQRMTYEGQAAMALEAAVDESEAGDYPMPVVATDTRHVLTAGWLRPEWVLDWEPMVRRLIADREAGRPSGLLAARVHNTLARAIVALAERAGESRVALTGGCFQNRVLTERTVHALTAAGFRPCWHQRVPPNDGGLALGQIAAVAARLAGCAAPDALVAPVAPGICTREDQPCVSPFQAES